MKAICLDWERHYPLISSWVPHLVVWQGRVSSYWWVRRCRGPTGIWPLLNLSANIFRTSVNSLSTPPLLSKNHVTEKLQVVLNRERFVWFPVWFPVETGTSTHLCRSHHQGNQTLGKNIHNKRHPSHLHWNRGGTFWTKMTPKKPLFAVNRSVRGQYPFL